MGSGTQRHLLVPVGFFFFFNDSFILCTLYIAVLPECTSCGDVKSPGTGITNSCELPTMWVLGIKYSSWAIRSEDFRPSLLCSVSDSISSCDAY